MEEKYYVIKEFDKGSFLYLCSLELYKDVIGEHDDNNNIEGNKKNAILFKDERRADAIADFVRGFSVKQSDGIK
mgnify:CR=1 FL=1